MKLYHEAACLTWIWEWINFDNAQTLALEGFNKLFGWHAYLMYGKSKMDGLFRHYYIRNALIKAWLKYFKFLPKERLLWIVPSEVIQIAPWRKPTGQLAYQDMIEFDTREVKLKTEELKDVYNWWEYFQINSLFKSDKKNYGFRKERTELETILMGDTCKMISKIYKSLLKWYTADEYVKEFMLTWSLNANVEIQMEQWEHIWRKSLKISSCTMLQENCYKILSRWYITPKKLSKMFKGVANVCWKCWNFGLSKEYKFPDYYIGK